jgi:scyllo-inositol 2-dehydrogenase (NADP+)
MRAVVVGLGVQGRKRRAVASCEAVATVDTVNPEAQYRRIQDVPLGSYDAALVCTPDEPKLEVLAHLLANGKHALVEKPLWAPTEGAIEHLQGLARASGAVCYTAYNHRFEPHYVRMRDVLASGVLGNVYHCRMFYGNGTARLVRDSAWRDTGAGVLPDLGSHLLDTAMFWFGGLAEDWSVYSARRFENRAPDHVVIGSRGNRPQLEFEMTLLSWRNHFTCDLFGERGSAHIRSLCKWGPSTFTLRTRVLPSGRPAEDVTTLEHPDPTWALEYAHFKSLCASGARTDLQRDFWLQKTLRRLGGEAIEMAGAQ